MVLYGHKPILKKKYSIEQGVLKLTLKNMRKESKLKSEKGMLPANEQYDIFEIKISLITNEAKGSY